MKLAILSAMREEITPIIAKFEERGIAVAKSRVGGNDYYEVDYKGHSLVLAYSKIGKVHSSITATTMILRFKVEALIFSGVAGALASDLRVCDMLLATRLCQHDVDITAFGHPLGFIPESAIYMESDPRLNEIARKVAKDSGIELKEGVIASGDEFIADAAKKERIIENFGAACVEMEGASVGVACTAFGVPFCVLRSISDSADGEADMSFDEFLESSAKASGEFVFKMIDEL